MKRRFYLMSLLSFLALTALISDVLVPRVFAIDFSVTPVYRSDLVYSQNGHDYGSAVSESKVSIDPAYMGQSIVYGPNNPIFYSGLMAEETSADQGGPTYLHFMKITIEITNSSGSTLPPINVGNLGMNVSPNNSASTIDWGQIMSELNGILQSIGYPQIGNLSNPASVSTSGCTTSATGVGCDSSTDWAQWTIPAFSSGIYSEGISFRYQPNFPKPDVYTVHVSTETDLWTTEYPGHFLTSATSSYSFSYVYESDANSGNDAGSTFSTATGISLGSYNGLLHVADTVDTYKFDGFAGQTIYYNLVPPLSADLGARFYDPNWNLIPGAGGDPGTGNTLYGSFVPSTTGSFYEQIYLTSGSGTYNFGLSASPFPPGIQLSANPTSVLVCPSDAYAGSIVTVTSLNGFSGNVYVSGSPYDSTLSTFSAWPQWASVSVPPGGSATDSFNLVGGNNPYPQPGAHIFTLTGTSGSITASTQVTMNVSGMNPCCLSQNGCGGGGGSVADGTLITMSDGSRVPIQNLDVGNEMLGYNTTTRQFTTSIVNSIKVVDTQNQLIIHTASGAPFRVDANPRQTLWVRTGTGAVGWDSVIRITVGDSLFTINGWTPVTGIEYAPAGNHVMYDITSSNPYFASGYLDPISKT